MLELAIHLSDDLMAFVNRKASEGFESPENFVLTLVEMSRLEEKVERENSKHPQREALEQRLREQGQNV